MEFVFICDVVALNTALETLACGHDVVYPKGLVCLTTLTFVFILIEFAPKNQRISEILVNLRENQSDKRLSSLCRCFFSPNLSWDLTDMGFINAYF